MCSVKPQFLRSDFPQLFKVVRLCLNRVSGLYLWALPLEATGKSKEHVCSIIEPYVKQGGGCFQYIFHD